jgi:mono/diheme cytochrome c family protein
MLPTPIVTMFLLLSLLVVSPGQKTSSLPPKSNPAHVPLDGAKIFQQHCATCHGTDGRGHGPAAGALQQPPQDLTLLSRKNGGKFPYQQVKEITDGKRSPTAAHGTREMPVWGPIFHQVESDQDWGEVRLDAVTKYLESLQQK